MAGLEVIVGVVKAGKIANGMSTMESGRRGIRSAEHIIVVQVIRGNILQIVVLRKGMPRHIRGWLGWCRGGHHPLSELMHVPLDLV